ncbi:thioredoxin family protein [Solimicrobium silvestre]|uniref:Thioredoxin n=1 Tax=Solimicrobium silvestre TaxID=2099400 RepID=A0A2S9GT87_9BURK|nr:thioredoxin family protein [Solimicrobium silvestre]PRC90925.1 Thioredoxin [Solimicrobium silvestre]
MFIRFITAMIFSVIFCGAALAAGKPYDAATFDALKNEGKPIMVLVSAPWCPYCKRQDEVVNTLLKDPRFQTLNVVDVDFDTHQDFLKTWHVPIQSTIIMIKGGKVISQNAFDIHADSIEAMMLKAL